MMLNWTKKLERQNKEIMKLAQYEEMKHEKEKLRDEVESLNDQLLIKENEHEEAENNRRMLENLFENNIIDKDGNLLDK